MDLLMSMNLDLALAFFVTLLMNKMLLNKSFNFLILNKEIILDLKTLLLDYKKSKNKSKMTLLFLKI
jgi:hypothetical protein